MSSIKLKHSGGNGVSISAPDTNPSSDRTLKLPSTDTDGVITTKDSNDSLQAVTGVDGGSFGHRNLIINGAMQVAQRGTSSTTNGYGSVDRIYVGYNGTDEGPTQAQVDVASGTTPYTLGFRKAFRVTNGNQSSGAGAGDYIYFNAQAIEAQNLANSGWNFKSNSSNITLSFYVKSSVAQNFYFQFDVRDGTRYAYAMETGTLTANTWTKITKVIPGNSNLTIDNDNGIGAFITFGLFWGTNLTSNSVSLNAWGVANDSAKTPDYTSTWYTTNDATFEITGVQLEVGSTATNFEHRLFSQELALCQRYTIAYDLLGSVDNFSVLCQGRWFSATQAQCFLPFPNEMRDLPSIDATHTSAVGTFFLNTGGGLAGQAMTSLVLNERSNKGMTFTCENGASGQTTGLGTSIYADHSDDAKLVITAEL